MASLSVLLTKLDINIQVRGRQFEHICKWYLENAPKYRLELKKVWLWKDWPGRWGPDCGIDLVAKGYDGKVWAIQAKAYDKLYPIKKADIDTFLSETSRPEITFRLLISTTNLIGKTAQRTIESQEKKVGLVLLSNLLKSEIEWPDSPDELFAKPPKPKTPRPHQVKAIDDVVKGFSENERGQLIMACGTGKTLVSLWIAEKLDCQRTLILLPSLSLLAQTLGEWSINTLQEFHYLPVCSDDTVRGEDHFTSHTSELGLPVTTDPAEVAGFLRKKSNLVVFSTYQSSPVIAKAFAEYSIPGFDLAIADEAHRCAGAVTGIFSTIMDKNLIKAERRLFMTATPRYFTDKAHKEAKELEYEIASMDDDEKFGPIFHRLNFSEAIEKDLLSDYQVVIIGVDNATYKKYAEYETIVTTNGKDVTDAKTLASQIALSKVMRRYDLKKVISFHGRIKRAKKFSEKFPDVIEWMPEELRPKGKIWTSHVSGEMSSGQRSMRLDRLRHLEDGERGLLSNARCLGEGVDVPTLDGVAFIDPRHSQIDIVQAVGRAIRKATDKKSGVIVLPVFINESQDHESALESSAFKPIWEILKALRAHDDVLAAELDSLRRQLGPENKTKTSVPDKLIIELPITVGEPFAEAFKIKIVKKASSSWQFGYGHVLQFVEKNGHATIPSSFVSKDAFNLGTWAITQRHEYQNGILSKDRQAALEKLPGWIWDLHEKKWQNGFTHLKDYIHNNGFIHIPQLYRTNDGFKLGQWVQSYQVAYQNGRLSKKRQELLESLPGWEWRDTKKRTSRKDTKGKNVGRLSWERQLQYLKEYVKQYGHSNVPREYVSEGGFNLGRWVVTQRYLFKKGALSKDRQHALQNITMWTWEGKRKIADGASKEWLKSLDRLKKYVEREGHADVPANYKTKDGYKLGNWVRDQRYLKKKGYLSKRRLTNKQVNLLEQIPGWVWKSKRNLVRIPWNETYELLKKFCENKGHARVHQHYKTEDNYGLGAWVGTQRAIYKKGKLSKKKQELLEKLPGWVWYARKDRWQTGYKYLCDYAKSNGTSRVSSGYTTEDGYKLGKWVASQKVLKRKNLLTTERQKKLEKFPDWTWGGIGKTPQDWQKSLNSLNAYVKEHGNVNVPSKYKTKDGLELGIWVSNQRQSYKRGKLSKKKQELLEKLPGWAWDAIKDRWLKGYKHLCNYVTSNGKSQVPSGYTTEDGYNLGIWVTTQRTRNRKGLLTNERQKKLEKLPDWTWKSIRITSQGWQERLSSLIEYAKEHGNTNVPSKYKTKDGFGLGIWVSNQRRLYKKGKLSQERIKVLEKMNGWLWDARKRKLTKQSTSMARGQ